ncbi:cadherin domain-containing protein [Muricauda sp. SK9]|uniref:cadherin domain-containing protein n=1 Tax=Flavobacteriaceae TaxID=49546 RepID=UPI0015FEC3FC|nr:MULTISPECIES: cadherin domain-containing protein [Allomuricauda]MDC6384657.1 cadherin domain-containing protein [Muricauda sp. SK9]
MNNKNRLSYFFILTLLLTALGCSSDDANIEVNLQNLETTLDENPAEGYTVGTIEATGGTAVNFSITSQSPSGAMNIDASSGEITVADASLFDFETNPIITATVTANNAENTATLTVNLNNVGEVSAQSFEATIDENPADGQVIGAIQAGGSASGFSISSQSPSGALSIDANSGELTVADASLFDFETNPIITATISINDADNPATVTINLNDVMEWSTQDFTADLDENPTDGQVVGTIQVSGGGTFGFSITSQTPAGALSIDATTGALSVLDPNLFDYETNPVITATILVDDGVFTDTATATINLNDVDEIVVQQANFTVDENPSNGDVVGTVQATSNGSLTYAITFQNPAGAFTIDQNTGELTVADESLFDYEANPNMLATISVDNGTYSVSANAFVVLTNINEVGDFNHGGVIFWVDPVDNDHGLVSSIADQGVAQWGCDSVFINGATGTALGTGKINTEAIVSACPEVQIAAKLAAELSLNGFDDWFLPSADELNELYLNKSIVNATITANGGNAFTNSTYWSSTQDNIEPGFALFKGFNGFEGSDLKYLTFHVRAIREFDLGN